MIVHYSDDGAYAYCAGAGMRGFWLSTAMFTPGSFSEKYPNPGLFTPEGIELKHPDSRQPSYERFVLPFTFWKVRNDLHVTKELPDDDLFVLDYELHKAWRLEQMGVRNVG